MKLYPIKCSCGSTRATKLTDKLANCVVCANPHDIQDVDYYTYEVTPLNDIMQQAKDQAVIDMWIDDIPYISSVLNGTVLVDDNDKIIKEDFTDVVRMVEVDEAYRKQRKERFDSYNTDHLPF